MRNLRTENFARNFRPDEKKFTTVGAGLNRRLSEKFAVSTRLGISLYQPTAHLRSTQDGDVIIFQ